ncbi:MAG: Holliday junction resolvase RuvX [candidate division Zixibacteria bacterium]|nr:Holliday junction resolvase RuvX [candidate division Zixibacteria bacterium]
MATDKTYLSIDYGLRRIGLAKSDPTGMIASALMTIEGKSEPEALKKLADVIAEVSPSALIVGYPLNDDGSINEACRRVDSFVEQLKSVYNGPIYRVDEFGTSEEAAEIVHAHGKKIGKKKAKIDRLAAVIILQRFLDEQV